MARLPASVTDRLAKLIPRLASDHPGEVVATVEAIRKTLAAARVDLHDLAAALLNGRTRGMHARPAPDAISIGGLPAETQRAIIFDLWSASGLTDWERRFLQSLYAQLGRGRPLSEKQANTVDGIRARVADE